MNTPLTIQSENGADYTTVQAARSNEHVFEVSADYVNIIGFSVQNASDNAGIYLYNSDYCTISDNTASNNAEGIFVNPSSDCTLTNNIASNNGVGIHMDSSSNNTISNNNVNSGGIYLVYSSNNTRSGNVVSDSGSGIVLGYSDSILRH